MANRESLYPSSPKLRFPEWQKPYFEAVLEVDPQQLQEKVRDAETAIYRRLQQWVGDGREERLAINDAMFNLRMLKTEKLGYPN